MSEKYFIALADVIIDHNTKNNAVFGIHAARMNFSPEAIDVLADFCQSQNSAFMRDRWLDYIYGKCGPNGGTIKGAK